MLEKKRRQTGIECKSLLRNKSFGRESEREKLLKQKEDGKDDDDKRKKLSQSEACGINCGYFVLIRRTLSRTYVYTIHEHPAQ